MKPTTKIFFFSNIPAPYNIPFYQKLFEKLNGGIKFFFDSENEENRKWKIDFHSIDFHFEIKNSFKLQTASKASNNTTLRRTIYFPFWIFTEILKNRPKKIISSEFGFRTILCLFAGRIIKAKVYVISDVTLHSEEKISLFKKFIRKILSINLDGGIAKSKKAKEYLVSLGFNENRIVISPYAVDNSYYIKISDKYSKQKVRSEYNYNFDDFILVYIGQFIHRKGIDLLIENVFRFNEFSDKKIKIILIGGDESELRNICKDYDLSKLDIIQYLEKEDLIKFFKLADYLILPSRFDTWGVVVNEALASGCPAIISKYVGASNDLIEDKVNGIIFNPLNDTDFQGSIKEAFKLNTLFESQKEKIYKSVSHFNYDSAVESVVNLINEDNSIK